MDEWLSAEEIIQDLLTSLRETEWIETYVRCGCCGDWKDLCPNCRQNQEKGHSEYCQLALRIRQAEAYLNPSTPGGLTVWERLDHEALPDHSA